MVFHKDETHSLYMAVSDDGYTFTALNDGKPVIAGDTIALQKVSVTRTSSVDRTELSTFP